MCVQIEGIGFRAWRDVLSGRIAGYNSCALLRWLGYRGKNIYLVRGKVALIWLLVGRPSLPVYNAFPRLEQYKNEVWRWFEVGDQIMANRFKVVPYSGCDVVYLGLRNYGLVIYWVRPC